MEDSQKVNKFVSNEIKISVVVLSWNTKELLLKCLKSIPFSVEIMVVDNGSTDGTLSALESLKWPNLKIIKNESNQGFAKGNNQGIKAALGDLIMILNSDTIVQKGALEKLRDFYLQQKEKDLALSPLLVNPDGSPQENYYMRLPNLWQIFGYHHPLLRPLVMKTPLRWKILSRIKSQSFEVKQLPGAALMAPKKVWQKVGLLDEDYQFLYEDVDWSFRAQKKGCRLMIVPGAKITHLGGASWGKKIKKESFDFYCQFFSSLLLFVQKNYGKWKVKRFKNALVLNFILQGKFKLAQYFLTMREIKQEKLWP
ncbi:glycosyltransferase family 2 protein [Candidatus Shapirobacteria bacterium]|nr:glycosyltransferase family 2 protein [Candidatus Shapirobacteria bacterium]